MSAHSPKNTGAKKTKSEPLVDSKELELLKNRDPKFLESIFIEVNPYLSHICLANGIYQENVSEVIHQTWEQFFANLEKFEGRSKIRTFICGILFNKIREHRRTKKKYVLKEDSQKFMDETFTQDGWWKVWPKNPHKLLENKETTKFIQECLEGLTEQQTTAFVLREIEGERSENICNILKVNVSNLGVVIFRAKAKLRECLEGKLEVHKA